MKMLLIVAMLSGCTGSDPHAIVDCIGYTTTDGSGAVHPLVAKCELACEMPPPGFDRYGFGSGSGSSCNAATVDGPMPCTGTFIVDGHRGCCELPIQSPPPVLLIRFAECK